jgi:hypothetical protein
MAAPPSPCDSCRKATGGLPTAELQLVAPVRQAEAYVPATRGLHAAVPQTLGLCRQTFMRRLGWDPFGTLSGGLCPSALVPLCSPWRLRRPSSPSCALPGASLDSASLSEFAGQVYIVYIATMYSMCLCSHIHLQHGVQCTACSKGRFPWSCGCQPWIRLVRRTAGVGPCVPALLALGTAGTDMDTAGAGMAAPSAVHTLLL